MLKYNYIIWVNDLKPHSANKPLVLVISWMLSAMQWSSKYQRNQSANMPEKYFGFIPFIADQLGSLHTNYLLSHKTKKKTRKHEEIHIWRLKNLVFYRNDQTNANELVLLKFSAALPSTTAIVEISFSKKKRIKTYIRNRK